MLLELAAQGAFADPGLFGQFRERAVSQLAAIDARQQTCQFNRQIATGGGGQLRAAAQAGSQPILLGGRGALEVAHIVLVRWPCRADWPAVDAGREHAGKEAAIEASVAGEPCGVALLAAEGVDLVILWLVTLVLRRHGMALLLVGAGCLLMRHKRDE